MTSSQWRTCLHEQHRLHGKTVFTVTELANISGHSPHVLSVELHRLCTQQILVRYAQGRYGLPDAVTPESLVKHLDPGAYITGAYALHRHNLITQVPVEITCFTNRRHNRSRIRSTPLGRFAFICVRPPVYSPPDDAPLAPPEQALCDLIFLMRRKGLDAQSQFTFRGLDRLDAQTLAHIAPRYPVTVIKMLHDMYLLSERKPQDGHTPSDARPEK